MAKSKPAFQFYASDWLGSTKRAMMTPAQRGAYIDLLAHQWNDPDCTLPDDDQLLSVLSGLGEEWFAGGSVLVRKCFPVASGKPGRIANLRLLEVKANSDAWSEKSQKGGIQSGVVRRAKSEQNKTSDDSDQQIDSEPNVNQTRTKREPKGKPSSPSPSPRRIESNRSETTIEIDWEDVFLTGWRYAKRVKGKIVWNKSNKALLFEATALVLSNQIPERCLVDALEGLAKTTELVKKPGGYLTTCITEKVEKIGKTFQTLRASVDVPEEILTRKR